jgi:glycosyltransferase involved in cell wall biosynthesis
MALSAAARPRVLLVHNAYQQRGGEDSVVDAELALLREGGHAVETYFRHNDEVAAMSAPALLANTLWSRRTVDDLDGLAQRFRPDVIHVHNTQPLISPSVFWAAARLQVPVVQTLHNFRLMCPQGMLLRDEKVCEDCVGHVPWRGVWHRCYRRSAAQSAVVAATVTLHRAAGTWRHKVSRYIALNRFCRDKFVQGGLPAERLRIKPNFVDVPAPAACMPRAGGLFVGRLSVEKGVAVLARALAIEPDATLSVIGAGELEPALRAVVGERMLGFLPLAQILARMQRASWLVVPSIWYENFPRTIVEAYACGLPVIASRLGALPELVEDGHTGLLFEPGSAEDLARKLHWAHHHPDEMARMGQQARARYETMYTPERNLTMLNEIYADAIDSERRDA